MSELEDKVALAAPLEWLAEELLVVDTAGPNPATWPILKAYSLQVQPPLRRGAAAVLSLVHAWCDACPQASRGFSGWLGVADRHVAGRAEQKPLAGLLQCGAAEACSFHSLCLLV